MIEIGLRIKNLRKDNKLTQTELGEKLDASHSKINRWENGKSTPNHNQITLLAKFLKTTPEYITFGQEVAHDNIDNHPIIPPLPKSGKNVVAFQGEMGAYSNLATKKIYPSAELLPCRSFRQAFEMVQSGKADYAVIPIENSLGGRVADIHHLLPESKLHIIGEHYQPIEHCLLGVKGATITDIKSVYSHEQAL
ncbi:MAG: prephenate dehydratase domain-containing protein, partial [Alphaproteobacteria bacterium]